MRTFKIYSLGNIQVYKAVWLAIMTMLYIGSPELSNIITGSFYSKEFKCYLKWSQNNGLGFYLSLSLFNLQLDFKWSYPVFLNLELLRENLKVVGFKGVKESKHKAPGWGMPRLLSCHSHLGSQAYFPGTKSASYLNSHPYSHFPTVVRPSSPSSLWLHSCVSHPGTHAISAFAIPVTQEEHHPPGYL